MNGLLSIMQLFLSAIRTCLYVDFDLRSQNQIFTGSNVLKLEPNQFKTFKILANVLMDNFI